MRNLTLVKFKLGGSYRIGDWKTECVFIKTSPKGYNFLNIKTHECILEKSMFKYKNMETDLDGYNLFMVLCSFKFWEMNRKTNKK